MLQSYQEPERADSDEDMLEITQGLKLTRPTSGSTLSTSFDMNQGDLGLGALDRRNQGDLGLGTLGEHTVAI